MSSIPSRGTQGLRPEAGALVPSRWPPRGAQHGGLRREAQSNRTRVLTMEWCLGGA